jgi:hypothetical protein
MLYIFEKKYDTRDLSYSQRRSSLFLEFWTLEDEDSTFPEMSATTHPTTYDNAPEDLNPHNHKLFS